MSTLQPYAVDVVILGGGGAGLWLLDELVRRGFEAVLLEHRALGAGQTIASQGIIHGGLKYTLSGELSASAQAVREMPDIWRACLAGQRTPELRHTRVLSEFCHLWRTSSLKSIVGMFGAQVGLRTVPRKIDAAERPSALRSCPGDVLRLDEPVIDPRSFLADLSGRNGGRLLRIGAEQPAEFECSGPGVVTSVRIFHPVTGAPRELRPDHVVFTAGAGNASLRQRAHLSPEAMQLRPLHMVLARGPLPPLFGHCVDGAKTRVTVTTHVDSSGRGVWTVGGQISEDGVKMSPEALIRHARDELAAVLPDVNFAPVEWRTHRVDRAEARTADGAKPADAQAIREGNVITAWPTKLVLFPRLAEVVAGLLGAPRSQLAAEPSLWEHWPRPEVATLPADSENGWVRPGQ